MPLMVAEQGLKVSPDLLEFLVGQLVGIEQPSKP
jgi:hypothetical protein